MSTRRNLLGLSWPALTDFFAEIKQPEFRARQLMEWVYARGVSDFSLMTNFPKSLREQLAEVACIGSGEIVQSQTSADGTIKFALSFGPEETVECVLLHYHHGVTLCLSSQVGCKMGCAFCASGLGGHFSHLSVSQIIEQIWQANRLLEPANLRVGNLVFMGMGEPLDNYQNVLDSIRLANAQYSFNIGLRHITVSTCGLVPKIYDLAEEGLPLTLSVSLHAPTDYVREQIMPINKRYGIDDLMEAAKYYAKLTKRRVTFEYILLKDINDQRVHARQLAELLADMLCNVNLIPYNEVDGLPWKAPAGKQVQQFHKELTAAGVSATVRRQLGPEIDAACGQLMRRLEGEEK